MPIDPLGPEIPEETLLGYALNRLIRGDTPRQAYESLRRLSALSHYSTQALTGAIRTAQRLQGMAEALEQSGGEFARLSSLFPQLRDVDTYGYRVIYEYTDRFGRPRVASTTVDAPASASREEILSAGLEWLQNSFPGADTVGFTPGAEPSGSIYAVLPGGYQTRRASVQES